MFSDQNLCERLVFAISATCLTYLISFCMFILLIRDGQYNLQSFPIYNFFIPHAPFVPHVQLFSSPACSQTCLLNANPVKLRQGITEIQNNRQNYIFIHFNLRLLYIVLETREALYI
jgi:hypothetical protein